MNSHFLNSLFFLITTISLGQIKFERGYFIDNKNIKKECLIKNVQWKYNPTNIEYKLNETGQIYKGSISQIKEFSINNTSKYIRATVNIDQSNEFADYLSKNRNPEFKEATVYLKVLLDGDANLYLYDARSLRRFFYNTSSKKNIEQLVYKSYLGKNNVDILKNNHFKNQLWNDVKCPSFDIVKVEKLDYYKKELIKYFKEYNSCSNSDYEIIGEKKNISRKVFNFRFRLGLNASSLKIHRDPNADAVHNRDTDFGKQNNLRLGTELEFILPFNNNKWSITIEPTYQYFNAEGETSRETVSVDYKSVELPISIRHYFYLNNDSKLFLNAGLIADMPIGSIIDFDSGFNDLSPHMNINFAFGAGYSIKDKYQFELRIHTLREFLLSDLSWQSDYNTASIIFGYTLF